MATMAAVDLGAQSGRVAVGRFDGARLTVEEVHRFPNVPGADAGTPPLGRPPALRATCSTASAPPAARRSRIDSVGVDSWAVDFGLLDARGRLVQNPVHYRDAAPAEPLPTVLLATVPARELYERTGIQLMPDQHDLRARRDGRRATTRRSTPRETLLLIPDLLHYWLCGARVTEFTNATTTQCFDARASAVGRRPPRAARRAGAPPGRARRAGHDARPARRRRRRRDGTARRPRRSRPRRTTPPRPSPAVPFREPGSAYISAGTWSLVGRRGRPTR